MYDWQRRLELHAARDSALAKTIKHSNVPRSDGASGREVLMERKVDAVEVLRNGHLVVTWDGEDGRSVNLLEVGRGTREGTGIELDGLDWWNIAVYNDLVLCATKEESLLLWDSQSGVVLEVHELEGEPTSIAVGGSCVVVGLRNGAIQVVDLLPETDRLVTRCVLRNVHNGRVIVATHGDLFAASTLDRVWVWDGRRRRCLASLPIEPERNWCHLVNINDKLLVVSRSNEVRVYDREKDYKLRFIIQLPNAEICAVELLHGEKALVAMESSNTLALLCLHTGDVLKCIQTPVGDTVKVTADARIVLTSYRPKKSLTVINPPNGTFKSVIENHAYILFGKHFVTQSRRADSESPKSMSMMRVLGMAAVGVAAISLFRTLNRTNA